MKDVGTGDKSKILVKVGFLIGDSHKYIHKYTHTNLDTLPVLTLALDRRE